MTRRSAGARDVVFHALNALPALRGDGPTGGAETQVALVARELARRGKRVAVVVWGDRAPGSVDGVDILLQKRGRGQRVLGPLVLAWHCVRAIGRADAPVVVQRVAGPSTLFVALAARLRRSRFVYSSACDLDFSFPERRGRLARAFGAAVRLADDIVVQTHVQEELCEAALARRGTLIPSIAEPAPPQEGVPSAFLWIGRAAPEKRPEAYLELAAAVPELPFRMVLAPGPDVAGELRGRIAARARQLPNVELLDARPRAALAPLYDEAVAVVSTSGAEGMPNVLLEGWARGVPALVLSFDPDGVVARERLGEVAHGDPDRLAALARDMWANRAHRSSLAQRCIAYVRARHSADRAAELWTQVIDGSAARAA